MMGSDLRLWRKKHGLTQADLATELEVSRQTVTVWESASGLPKLLVLALDALSRQWEVAGEAMSDAQQDALRMRPDEPGSTLPLETLNG